MAHVDPNALPYPGDEATNEDLIKYYHRFLYTQKEIRGFLILRHGRIITKTRLRRTIARLGLRKREAGYSVNSVLMHILHLFNDGFIDCGYRAIWRMLHIRFGLYVTQETVRHILNVIDPTGVDLRRRNRLRRRIYRSRGPNYIVHMDGYDKLKPFGFAIHGCIDGFSRRILWLKVVRSNNNPYVISRLYLEHLLESGRLPRLIRCDGGNENIVVCDIHKVLRQCPGHNEDGEVSFVVGRSTANQRIEMFWGFLKKHFTQYWRNIFKDLSDIGAFNTACADDIEAARLWFTPVLQDHLNRFSEYWNSHPIRAQRDVELTTGASPELMFYQPELFQANDNSIPLPCSAEDLQQLMEDFSISEPPLGCTNEFFERVVTLSGIPPENFERPMTTVDALNLFYLTKLLLESH